MSVKEHGLTSQVCKVEVGNVVRATAGWWAWLLLPVVALLFKTSGQVRADEGFVVPNAHPPKGEYAGKDVEQPIEFPHNNHTKNNQINCMYCHTYARRSKGAGGPPAGGGGGGRGGGAAGGPRGE